MIEAPQPFVIRQESDKVAFQNGFRRKLGENEGWASFSSTTVPGTIHLAAGGAQGPWFLALDHTGVIEELDMPAVDMPGPGHTRYAFGTLGHAIGADAGQPRGDAAGGGQQEVARATGRVDDRESQERLGGILRLGLGFVEHGVERGIEQRLSTCRKQTLRPRPFGSSIMARA